MSSGAEPPPTASSLVVGEFVEFAPGQYVRAAKVLGVGTHRKSTVMSAAGATPGTSYTSPYPVRLVLAALNLALANGQQRSVALERE